VFPHWNWPGLEGQEIAVWVHSNMDRVELFHNGLSMGAKDLSEDQHLAWNVKYTPGTIEARGYKGGRQVMTAKRETTGEAAKLVLRLDRQEIAADGEDAAMCAVEVQDAQGRVVPITDNEISFNVTGPGRVLGTGNGDPTSHESDPGSTRKAFSGLCMSIVQSMKSAGSISIEATSPGLTAATATITARAVKLRPQAAAWERPVPTGPGITGLWRPTVVMGATAAENPMAPSVGSTDMVFSMHQDGDAIAGSVESTAGGFFGGGGATISMIEEGRIDGVNISFRAGIDTYTGRISGEQIELLRSSSSRSSFAGFGAQAAHADTGPHPAIGPPPDGSDPSSGAGFGRAAAPLILRRVIR